MNLLGDSGIQNNLDSIIKENSKIVKEQKKTPENQYSKKDIRYRMQCWLFNDLVCQEFC